MRPKKFVTACCFCDRGVPRKGLEPLSLAVFAAKGDRDTEQTFWCHKRCLAKAFSDPTILREELGGPKIKWDILRPVSEEKKAKILAAMGIKMGPPPPIKIPHQIPPQNWHNMGRKVSNGRNVTHKKTEVFRRRTVFRRRLG